MEPDCACQSLPADPVYQIACLECGEGCCPLCVFLYESAAYCSRCAESILEIPVQSRRSAHRTRDGLIG